MRRSIDFKVLKSAAWVDNLLIAMVEQNLNQEKKRDDVNDKGINEREVC